MISSAVVVGCVVMSRIILCTVDCSSITTDATGPGEEALDRTELSDTSYRLISPINKTTVQYSTCSTYRQNHGM